MLATASRTSLAISPGCWLRVKCPASEILTRLTWGLASSTSRSSSVIPTSSLSPYTTHAGTPESAKRGASEPSRSRYSRYRWGLPAEEVRVVLLQLGDQCFAAGRRQAALHRRTHDLQHQRIGQVPGRRRALITDAVAATSC